MLLSTVMMISGLAGLFAVALMGATLVVARGASAGVARNPGLFKTGNPALTGERASQGMPKPHVEVPATIERGTQPREV